MYLGAGLQHSGFGGEIVRCVETRQVSCKLIILLEPLFSPTAFVFIYPSGCVFTYACCSGTVAITCYVDNPDEENDHPRMYVSIYSCVLHVSRFYFKSIRL